MLAAQVDHYSDRLVDLYFSVLQHRKAEVEAHLSFVPGRQLMGDVLEGHVEEVQQVADGLPGAADGEVVQPHRALRFPRLHLNTMLENGR